MQTLNKCEKIWRVAFFKKFYKLLINMDNLDRIIRSVLLILSFSILPLFSLFAKEISLKEFLALALKNNLELKAFQQAIKASELEKEAAKGAYFPRLKLEELLSHSDIPAQVFTFKLNQEEFSAKDFEIKKLNDPKSRTNFETRLTLELPIWLGGKIQAQVKQAEAHFRALKNLYERKEEEVLSQVYQAYLFAILSKESIKVSESSIREAEEHLRIAKARYQAGTALLSDVYRAEVYLNRAKESQEKAKNYYSLAKKNLELLVNTSLGDFEVEDLASIPQIEIERVKTLAFQNRKDLKALEEEIKTQREAYKVTLSENLPQISAFATYSLNDKNYPFGSSGSGYLLGLGLTWKFDTGLTTLKKAQAELQKSSSLEKKYLFLKNNILFEIEKAHTEYQNALYKFKSAESRIQASTEMLRIIQLRYQSGLARMLDLLDAQSELDQARLERLQALKDLHEAYMQILLAGGILKEAL